MAKFKGYRAQKRKTQQPKPNALPCVILMVLGFLILALMFYLMLQSSS